MSKTNFVANPVSAYDFLATILCIDRTRLTYPSQGRQHRLTDVHGEVIEPILA